MDEHIYKRAESFLPWNLYHTVLNSTIFPYWTDDALYYFQQAATGKTLLRIDINTGIKEKILDIQKLLNVFSKYLKQEINSAQLPLDGFAINENPCRLRFNYQGDDWCYDLQNHLIVKEKNVDPGLLSSPDNNWGLSTKEYNLILSDLIHCHDFQITTDGERYYDYASSPETNTCAVSKHLAGVILSPVAIWSPDSSKIVTHKLDQRNVNSLFLLQNSSDKSKRPELHSYRMSFSGDPNLPLAELLIIDIKSKSVIPIKTDPLLSPYLTPIEFKWVWWDEHCKKVYFLRESRGAKELSLCVADAETGNTSILITETSTTYVEPSQMFPWPHQVIILEDSKKVIWLSEQSGYSHLYLYDIGSNIAKQAITNGEWCVREVHFYDEKTNWIYFTACGYEQSTDPYFKKFFRCHLDGSELECLTAENASHTIDISPQKNCFLDTYSTINSAPISFLKRMNGTIICHIETADLKGLNDLGWIPPQRFCKKARDGTTDVYGNLYFPSNFDPNKKYPIIDHIYPGPQFYRTPMQFNLYGAIFRSAWTAQSLAELGFIVIHVDGLGTPGRSKAYHDATYKNMSDCGIPDHVSVITQLASQYTFIDLERIGITGYSGGGYAAARAMLTNPDFFKVAVAAAGNHDLRCYPANYGEKYNSLDVATYDNQSNAVLAKELKGKLLLIHGEMDDNVHPCATLQLVDALIKENKNFDMLIMPNQNHHSTFDHPYYIRRHWDYFVQHLLRVAPPKDYLISPMPLEFPQVKDW